MISTIFKVVLTVAAAAAFAFVPASQQDQVQEASAHVQFLVDPNPGGG